MVVGVVGDGDEALGVLVGTLASRLRRVLDRGLDPTGTPLALDVYLLEDGGGGEERGNGLDRRIRVEVAT